MPGSERWQGAMQYAQEHQVLTLATTGPDGPWAAAVFYVNDGFSFYFLSAGHTRHAQNLLHNTRAAATIQEDYEDWPAIKGIQLEGIVRLLEGEAAAMAQALYAEKYPFVKQAPSAIRRALANVNWYCLLAQRLYYIDNSMGFGHRDEFLSG